MGTPWLDSFPVPGMTNDHKYSVSEQHRAIISEFRRSDPRAARVGSFVKALLGGPPSGSLFHLQAAGIFSLILLPSFQTDNG